MSSRFRMVLTSSMTRSKSARMCFIFRNELMSFLRGLRDEMRLPVWRGTKAYQRECVVP